jgi:hypothetical protein
LDFSMSRMLGWEKIIICCLQEKFIKDIGNHHLMDQVRSRIPRREFCMPMFVLFSRHTPAEVGSGWPQCYFRALHLQCDRASVPALAKANRASKWPHERFHEKKQISHFLFTKHFTNH